MKLIDIVGILSGNCRYKLYVDGFYKGTFERDNLILLFLNLTVKCIYPVCVMDEDTPTVCIAIDLTTEE